MAESRTPERPQTPPATVVDHDVTIRRLVKRFGSAIAVDGIDLDVPAGSFVTFLGPSGCGKTTTLRMIGGFEHPDSGEILLKGELMRDRPPHRRDTSMVFQHYALFPHMTVADNIAYGLRERNVARSGIQQRVGEMLERVGLQGAGARMPRELSGGQQQRVALARSLVTHPTVLLLDEPLGALDLQLRRQMQVELKRLQQQIGTTFIHVTHDQEEALTMSDRIVVMNEGRIEQEGTAEEVYERPRTRFVATFMGMQNVLDVSVADRDAISARLALGTQQLTVATGIPAGVRQGAIAIRPEKIILDDREGWPGTVIERVYRGSVTSYTVRADSGVTFRVDVASDNTASHRDIGDDVFLAFRPDDVIFMPDQREPSLTSP